VDYLDEGVLEVRLEFQNVQHRILGCWGPAERTFTILVFATKKGDAWTPGNAVPLAVERRNAVLTSPDQAEEVDEWDT
jgi:hypothetical protein